MLRSLKDLEHYSVSATDGELGTVANFLVEDERWTVRYLVVQTGHFFADRRVLISPSFFRLTEWSTRRFHLALTRDQIQKSPSIDADKSVSRQHEFDYYGYYGYPYYWGYTGLWGMGNAPGLLSPLEEGERRPAATSSHRLGDTHLRSIRQLIGYDVHGGDGPVGKISDFIVDEETWQIRYFVIETGHWWLGNAVLVAPGWTNRVSWGESAVFLSLTRQAIKDSPAWSAGAPVNREYEAILYDYYGRPVYWDESGIAVKGDPIERRAP